MNKEEFITQLKQSINILDDQEQQYFVEEYSQHIEMKMSQGMSEEEAVREIGSIEELSREILESYHVKANLVENRVGKGIGCGEFLKKVKAQADKIYDKIILGCRKAAARIKKILAGWKERKNRLQKEEPAKAQKSEGQNEEGQNTGEQNRTERIGEKKSIGGMLHSFCCVCGSMCMRFFGFCGRLLRKCLYIALWCLILMWNCMAICCGLFGIFMMAVCVFLFGMFVVLLVQGYPFIGLTLCTLGATISIGALTAACFVLTKWKIGRNRNSEGGTAHA